MLNTNQKKFTAGLIGVGLVAVITALIVSVFFGKGYRTDVPKALDEAVALSTFTRLDVSMSDMMIDGEPRHYAAVDEHWKDNGEALYMTECLGEGHVILGYKQSGTTVEVYALCEADEYSFQNGMLVQWSGYSCVPTLIVFDRDKHGNYIFNSAKEASDGAKFASSTKKMFPGDLAEIAISASGDDEISTSLGQQSLKYAEAYLVSIGREDALWVNNGEEQEYMTLIGAGVAENVASELYDLHPEYGVFIGTIEKIEDGKRYVYATIWDGDLDGNGTVTFSKTAYESGKVVKKTSYKVKDDSYTLIKPKQKKKK